jgi:PIN domain
MTSGKREDDLGLRTRHVFLDTEVYRAHEHDLSSGPFRVLGSLIEESRVTLHVTDITLEEAGRHIREQAAEIERNTIELSRKSERWSRRFPRAKAPKIAKLDAEALASSANSGFKWTIECEWKAQKHEALNCPPRAIFERYFGRKPPFDQGKSKEFPDAFVIEALANWCTKTGSRMYVVTADAAMQRAATESRVLIPVPNLQALLEIATEAETPELTASVEKLVDTDQFRENIHKYIEEHIGWLGLIYSGDLAEGEILEAVVAREPEIQKISVISASRDTIGVILSVTAPLEVTVEYEDRSGAMYDKEDDRWYLTEQEVMEFEDEPLIRMYIEFKRPNLTVSEMDILTTDLHLSEPYENYK